MEITSLWMGLIASGLLWWPGWRASQYLKLIFEVKETAKAAAATGEETDRGKLLAAKLQGDNSVWNRAHHWMLGIGFALLFLSYALGIAANYAATG